MIGLAEHAHRRADEAVQYVDDSDGWLTDISYRLGEIHRRACAEGSPDPTALARCLVDLELTSELDTFHRAALGWAAVLGRDGIDEYRRLVAPRWAKLDPEADRTTGGFAVREARIGVALAAADPDELIEVRGQYLRLPDHYLEVAESLAAAGRVGEAIDWARRGLATFADRAWQTPPLREYLAGLLLGRGDAEGAVELFWIAFERHPSLDSYRRLLAEVDTTGMEGDWGRRAIEALRERLGTTPVEEPGRSLRGPTRAGALVEILLYEGDVGPAWDAAKRHGCDQRLWLTLARAREDGHPLDAVGVYEPEVRAQIDTKKNRGYRAAVDLLGRIRRLTDAAGRPERFEDLVAAVRDEHGRKRNLMGLMDKQGW